MSGGNRIPVPDAVVSIARAVAEAGGRAYVVGGCVRDALLGRRATDHDLEVHGLEPEVLGALLARWGVVAQVGRSFGVFKVVRKGPPRWELDVGIPRGDSAPGEAIAVRGDPFLGLDRAARRRDLTVNAIAYDPLDGTWHDPAGGIADAARRLLRAADPVRFSDDPLRVVRVARLAACLDFSVDPELVAFCRGIDLSALPVERVRIELEKLLLAPHPGHGLRVLAEIGAMARLLPAITDVEPVALSLDRAPRARRRVGGGPRQAAFRWAVLLHLLDEVDAHAVFERFGVERRLGYPLRARALHALSSWRRLREDPSDAALRALAEHGEVALVAGLAWAATGDPACLDLIARARAMGIAHGPLPELIRGRDLARLGVGTGPEMGHLLGEVREAQVRGEVATPEDALALARRLVAADSPRRTA